MPRTFIVVDTDIEFVSRLRQKLHDEAIGDEFDVECVVPHTTFPLGQMISDCVERVISTAASLEPAAVLIDIVIVETGDLDMSGIEIALELEKRFNSAPIYLVTAKLRGEQEQDLLSHATLLGLKVLLKSFFEGKTASAKRIKTVAGTRPTSPTPAQLEGASASPAKDDMYTEVLEWLSNELELDLSRFKVVGDFVVADRGRHDALALVVNELVAGFPTLDKPYPVLLCAPPGSGKTFFVDQVAARIGIDKAAIIKESLATANDLSQQLRKHFVSIAINRGTTIAFLDEVDTLVGVDSAYRFLLDAIKGDTVEYLAGVRKPLPGVLWFFAASSATDKEAFGRYLDDKVKGRDFLRRFNEAGTVIELGGINGWLDRIVQATVNMRAARPDLTDIEAVVLLYFSLSSWADAGALKQAARKAAKESRGGTIVRRSSIANEIAAQKVLADRAFEVGRLGNRLIKIK